MGHKMNKQEYAKCIEDDIDFLKRHLPESLFKCLWTGHIIEVLKASINMLYDQPSLPSNLDEEAEKCVTSIIYANGLYDGDFLIPVCEDIFKAGAEWDRGQMMSGAVEGEITKDDRGNNVVRAGVFNKDFEYGDRARIIIVKED